MLSKSNLGWLAYLLLYILVIIADVGSLAVPSSPVAMFYHILIAYDKKFLWDYSLRLLSVSLNCLSLIPLYLYISHMPLFKSWVWKQFFILKVLADFSGRLLEMNLLKATIQEDLQLTFSILFLISVLVAPSYQAIYEYAFRFRRVTTENDLPVPFQIPN